MPELRINPDKVCDFVEAARELAAKVPSTAGDRTTSGDDSPLHLSIEEVEGDPTRQQMVEFVAGLNVEEQVDLLALIYLGRGDYSIEEWDAALDAARDRIDGKDADFLIGNPTLPAYLEEGLQAFGRSCI
jgi:hypothetical protein